MADGDLIMADSADGTAHRAALGEFLAANDGENLSLGTELDVRYDNSPIVCTPDGQAPPWDRRTFVPTVRAGHRAPNIVVGPDETLFDSFGPGFTLVDACRRPEAKRLVDEAALSGISLHHLVVEDSRCRELYENQLVLVRRDLHIAWSGASVADAAAIIGRARGAA
jgi:FAD-dependent monooxygenase